MLTPPSAPTDVGSRNELDSLEAQGHGPLVFGHCVNVQIDELTQDRLCSTRGYDRQWRKAMAAVADKPAAFELPDELGQHLTQEHVAELIRLLLAALGSEEAAVRFLRDYNHYLMAKPIELLKRSPASVTGTNAGVERVLAYLRMAV